VLRTFRSHAPQSHIQPYGQRLNAIIHLHSQLHLRMLSKLLRTCCLNVRTHLRPRHIVERCSRSRRCRTMCSNNKNISYRVFWVARSTRPKYLAAGEIRDVARRGYRRPASVIEGCPRPSSCIPSTYQPTKLSISNSDHTDPLRI